MVDGAAEVVTMSKSIEDVTADSTGFDSPRLHPRTIGWVGTTALAMGGSNQSLFLIAGASGLIATQGSAGVGLLIFGLLLAWAAAPGWIELILMYPNRVGGIASCCAEAFRPYSEVLANLTGVCYWWGWIPTCGLTALLSSAALHQWYFPQVPVVAMAMGIITVFTAITLSGMKNVVRVAVPIAAASALLAFISALAPILTGQVDWRVATSFHLIVPFGGFFGKLTSAMAGLYLVGFAAPAFEAAACHVGETINPAKNVPRAMFASAGMASLYFVLLPLVWLGVFGSQTLQNDLQNILGPTFAPVLGPAARAAAIWFMTLNMFHGTLQPLAGAARTMSQLADDGLLPKVIGRRSRTDCPYVATLMTAGFSVIFLLIGDPIWLIAAANLTYLIGIGLPNVAVWLLRRNEPDMPRPYRAPDLTIGLGLCAAAMWAISTILGFQQFGLPTVLAGLALAYSGSLLYALRKWQDRRPSGEYRVGLSLHTKLTGSMLVVLVLVGAGYLMAIDHVSSDQKALIAGLQDIFVAVALLTISVGLVLPGMISQAANEIAGASRRLSSGTLAGFTRALSALGEGKLDLAYAEIDIIPVKVHSSDEMGQMADNFNQMQTQIALAALGLDGARESLRSARADMIKSNERFEIAVEGSQDGLWDWDLKSEEVYFSRRSKAILGYADEQIENERDWWKSSIHPEDIGHAMKSAESYLSGESPSYDVEFRMLHRDGGYRWVLSRGIAYRDEAGVAYRMAGSHTDITDRKKEEEERRRLDAYNRMLLECSGNGIYGVDLEGLCTFINGVGAKILGYSPAECFGKNMHYLIHHSYPDGSPYPVEDCPIFQAFKSGKACRLATEVMWRKDGTSYPVEYTSSPVLVDNAICGSVVTFVDISKRKRAEEELIQAKLAAESASRAKSLFLANMSHELRTPLNAVIGFSEMMQNPAIGELNVKQARFVGNTLSSGRHLLQLIEGVLDLSKIEAGRTNLYLTQFDPFDTVRSVRSSLESLAEQKEVKIVVESGDGIRRLTADLTRFKQVLYNLLSNSIKFTPNGGQITISMYADETDLHISISDTGIGLTAEHIEAIWGEFEQVDNSYSRSHQGTGLGLAVSRLLIKLHHGQIWAESEGEGKGSTFKIILPLNNPEFCK